MAGYLVAALLLLAAINTAVAVRGRISGGVQAENAPHACLVLVRTANMPAGQALLGGGSIVSRNRMLTAAHLVIDAVTGPEGIQVRYFQGRVSHRANALTFVVATGFDAETQENDLAVVIFANNAFPQANVIPISFDPALVSNGGGPLTIASFGFTDGTSTGPTQFAMSGTQTVVVACNAALNATTTHFCATDPATTVCRGDSGSGLYRVQAATATAPAVNTLVGLASTILPGCVAPLQSAFTRIHLFELFLLGQNIPSA